MTILKIVRYCSVMTLNYLFSRVLCAMSLIKFTHFIDPLCMTILNRTFMSECSIQKIYVNISEEGMVIIQMDIITFPLESRDNNGHLQ